MMMCHVCGKACYKLYMLRQHLYVHHKIKDPKLKVCICSSYHSDNICICSSYHSDNICICSSYHADNICICSSYHSDNVCIYSSYHSDNICICSSYHSDNICIYSSYHSDNICICSSYHADNICISCPQPPFSLSSLKPQLLVEPHSSHHVGTWSKSFTRCCLYNMMWRPAWLPCG